MRMYDRKCICKRGNVEKLVVCRIGGIGNKQFMKVGFPIINYEPFLNDSPLRCMKQNAGANRCYRTICIDYLPLSITRVAFFNPLDVASRGIFPGSSVDDTMAVIMPENTFMWGAWNDSNDVGSPLAPAR